MGHLGSGRAYYINPKEDKMLDSIKNDTSSNYWIIASTYATSLFQELRSDVPKVYRHPRQGLGTKMPSKYQQDYKKTQAYAPKIYNDPNMSHILRDIYRTLESRYVHEGRTIDPSFYNDLSNDSVAKFIAIGICIYSDAWGHDKLDKTLEQIEPYNSRLPALDDIRNLIHRRTVHEKIDKEGNTIHEMFILNPKKI
ncbi:hypothetical protein Tco_0936438 [Tanacetum coccineum]